MALLHGNRVKMYSYAASPWRRKTSYGDNLGIDGRLRVTIEGERPRVLLLSPCPLAHATASLRLILRPEGVK